MKYKILHVNTNRVILKIEFDYRKNFLSTVQSDEINTKNYLNKTFKNLVDKLYNELYSIHLSSWKIFNINSFY